MSLTSDREIAIKIGYTIASYVDVWGTVEDHVCSECKLPPIQDLTLMTENKYGPAICEKCLELLIAGGK